jgi:hypothetical protein
MKREDLSRDDIHRSYKILGLSPDASIEARKQAYKDLVKVWHPDRFSHDPRLQQKAQEKLQEINEAYEKIKSLTNDQSQGTSWKKEQHDSSFENQQAYKPPFSDNVLFRKRRKRSALVWIVFVVLFIGVSVILSQLGNRTEQIQSEHGDALPSESLPPSSPIPEQRAYVTIGSTKDEVRALQGNPSRIIGDTWFYDASQVTFSSDKVVGYANNSENLHMRLMPKTDMTHIREKGYFTIGATKDEVIALQGTPGSIIGNTWVYGLSQIKFYDDTVVSYSNASQNLKVKR